MGKISSIDPIDRNIAQAAERDPEEGTEELMWVTTLLGDALDDLAKKYPTAIAIGAISGGHRVSIFATTFSAKHQHFSPVAPQQLRTIARIIGHLPEELVDTFQKQLKHVLEIRQIRSEMEQARAEAIRVAHAETHSA